jgi:polar amino acid transport system substrate-binding protein
MRTIQDRGRLVVGVSADTLLMGARDPISGQIVGFDIDLAKAVARAIFGEDGHLELRVITAADRIPLLQDGEIDMVARNMTINCERWEQIAFSTEYYAAGQKILVPASSRARSLDDLVGKRVCAPFASTSLAKLDEYPDIVPVGSSTHTGCLVLFQQGQVDAITGDDTVLAGLAAQDPYAYVPPQQRAVSAEPYGLGFNSDDVDLVRFTNGVLEDIRADGRWQEFYVRWLADALNTRANLPSPPQPEYGK